MFLVNRVNNDHILWNYSVSNNTNISLDILHYSVGKKKGKKATTKKRKHFNMTNTVKL